MFLALIYEKPYDKPAIKTFGVVTLEEVLEHLEHMVTQEWLEYGEEKPYWYDYIELYEIAQKIEVPLSNWLAEGDKIVTAKEAKEQEEMERAEYKRLKEKYGCHSSDCT